ncbi:unnamed protein product [Musa banksii]
MCGEIGRSWCEPIPLSPHLSSRHRHRPRNSLLEDLSTATPHVLPPVARRLRHLRADELVGAVLGVSTSSKIDVQDPSWTCWSEINVLFLYQSSRVADLRFGEKVGSEQGGTLHMKTWSW